MTIANDGKTFAAALRPLRRNLAPAALERAKARLQGSDDKATLASCHPEVIGLLQMQAIAERERNAAARLESNGEEVRWLERVIGIHEEILRISDLHGMSADQLNKVRDAFERTQKRQKPAKRQR